MNDYFKYINKDLNITNESEILELGAGNIKSIINDIKYKINSNKSTIKDCKKYIEILEDIENKVINNPKIETCGECKYRGCGEYKGYAKDGGGYMIDGNCHILYYTSYNKSRYGSTPCVIRKSVNIEKAIKEKNKEIEKREYEINKYKEAIEYFNGFLEKTDYKPYLPSERPYVYKLKVGDDVILFYNKKFHKAKITNGYRYQDGILNLIYDNGKTGGIGWSAFTVMLEWEYKYLKEHPEYLDIYLSGWENKEDNIMNDFIDAIKA